MTLMDLKKDDVPFKTKGELKVLLKFTAAEEARIAADTGVEPVLVLPSDKELDKLSHEVLVQRAQEYIEKKTAAATDDIAPPPAADAAPAGGEQAGDDIVAPGMDNVTVAELKNPMEALAKAGFRDKDELLKLLDATRREQGVTEARRKALDLREEELNVREAQIFGREQSLNKKSAEVGAEYKKVSAMVDQIAEAKKSGWKP